MACPTWSDTYDGAGSSVDEAFAAATDAAGTTLFAGGYETDTATSLPGVVIAYDMTTGTRKWITKHAGTHEVMLISTLQATSDGTVVYGAGSNYSGGFAPCATDVFALNGATGAQLWDSPLPTGSGECQIYTDSKLSPDGSRLYVISDIRDAGVGGGVEQLLTAAFDTATGAQLWVAHAPITGNGVEGWRIALSPDGSRLYVASGVNGSFPEAPTSWMIFAYATSTGAQEWATIYDCRHQGGVICAEPAAIAATSSRVYVVGGNLVTEVLALSPVDGSQVWETDLNPTQQNFIYVLDHPIATATNGDVFVGYYQLDEQNVGGVNNNLKEWFATARLAEADGSVLWTQQMEANTPNNGTFCEGCGPVLTADASGSNVYVSGAYPLGDSLLTTEALNASTGAQEWNGLYLWSAGAEVDQLPEAITTPSAGPGVAIVGGANNATDTNPVVTCTICYDFAALVYPSASPATSTPEVPFLPLVPLAAGVVALAVRRCRKW
jgi:hypothetical protein